MATMPDMKVTVELDNEVRDMFISEIMHSEKRVMELVLKKQEEINKEFLRKQRVYSYRIIAFTMFFMTLFTLFLLSKLL